MVSMCQPRDRKKDAPARKLSPGFKSTDSNVFSMSLARLVPTSIFLSKGFMDPIYR